MTRDDAAVDRSSVRTAVRRKVRNVRQRTLAVCVLDKLDVKHIPARRGLRAYWIDRARRSRLRPDSGTPATVVYGIYRRKNVPILAATMCQMEPETEVYLWALDAVADELEHCTVGSGPGSKFALLDQLMLQCPPPTDAYVVVCDDDVVFQRGTLGKAVQVMQGAGFGVAMPAQGPASYANWAVNYRRRLTRARRSGFVEIGPVFMVSPEWRPRVLPFPEGIGMGWGLELAWHKLIREGCRLGIVDAVPMVHCEPAGATYDRRGESDRLERAMREAGITDYEAEVATTYQSWRPWQAKPPWCQ